MHDHNLLDGEYSPEDLIITQEAKTYLKEISKWAKFIAIVAIIFVGFMMIFSFMIGGMLQRSMAMTSQELPFSPMLISVFYLLISAIWIPPTIYLYKFANSTKAAVLTESTQNLTEALSNLKSIFKYYGIFIAIILSIYALIFVVGIGAAIFMGQALT